MKIAVILCTFNRGRDLSKALESLAASEMPHSEGWRILVIDNNSTDDTRSVVEEFVQRSPQRFEYLFEPRQGKSHALNLGVRHAMKEADVLAFTDDDVQVDPFWLHRLTSPLIFKEWSASCGRIAPPKAFTPPRWLGSDLRYGLAPLAMFDPNIDAGEIREPGFGANMAVRAEMFAKHGAYRTDLGPQPGGDIKNEDVDFGSRLLAAGERLWYEPSAVVYHSIPNQRLNRAYFLKWWYGKGRSDIRQLGTECDRYVSIFGVPLVFFRRMLIWTFRWLCGFDPSHRFDCRTKVWWLAGLVCEHFMQFRKARMRTPLTQETP